MRVETETFDAGYLTPGQCQRGRLQTNLLTRVHASREILIDLQSRKRITAVYLLRSAQYQFCNCGVLYLHACQYSTCIELNFGITEGTMAKKAKKAKKKTGKKKKK